jgi:hypothetical protein
VFDLLLRLIVDVFVIVDYRMDISEKNFEHYAAVAVVVVDVDDVMYTVDVIEMLN